MNHFVVFGYCDKGIKFRPSDWAERLVNSHTVSGSAKECVHVFNSDGTKGIAIKPCLEKTNPKLLNHILDFVGSHNLVIKYK